MKKLVFAFILMFSVMSCGYNTSKEMNFTDSTAVDTVEIDTIDSIN